MKINCTSYSWHHYHWQKWFDHICLYNDSKLGAFTIKNIAVQTFSFWCLRNIYNSPIAVKIFVIFFKMVTIATFMYFKLREKHNKTVLAKLVKNFMPRYKYRTLLEQNYIVLISLLLALGSLPLTILQNWVKKLRLKIINSMNPQFMVYLYMPDTSMPTKITLTGIQTLINFELSFSIETDPDNPNTITTRELIRFCRNILRNIQYLPNYRRFKLHYQHKIRSYKSREMY